MRLRLQMLFILASAAALLVPVVGVTGAQAVSAACGKSAAWTKTPNCVIKASPSAFAETGLGAASSVAFPLQVECKPVFAEQKAQINTSQLNSVCHGTLSWYSAAATGGQAPGTVTGESFTVVLDRDGNATAVVWGGPSCAAARDLVAADLTVAPFTTATTHVMILPPAQTPISLHAYPAGEVEHSTTSSVALASPSCASGEAFGRVDLVEPTYKTFTTNSRVLSPRVMV